MLSQITVKACPIALIIHCTDNDLYEDSLPNENRFRFFIRLI